MKRLLNDFIGYLNITPQMLVEAESRSDKKLIVLQKSLFEKYSHTDKKGITLINRMLLVIS